jgi:hypothetical protein
MNWQALTRMVALNNTAETPPFSESLLLALRNTALMGLALPPQLAQASWAEVERIFDLPEAKTLPYPVLDTYIELMTQGPVIKDDSIYHHRLQALDEALIAASAVPPETAREISYPVFGA